MQVEPWLLFSSAAALGIGIGVGISLMQRSSARRDGPTGPSKIERIKQYRERHGVGLKEAKDAVEAELRGATVTPPGKQIVDPESLEALLAQGNAIAAIKLYRQQTGVGLKDAKDAIDALREKLEREGRLRTPH